MGYSSHERFDRILAERFLFFGIVSYLFVDWSAVVCDTPDLCRHIFLFAGINVSWPHLPGSRLFLLQFQTLIIVNITNRSF
jgi:hypothetical protein